MKKTISYHTIKIEFITGPNFKYGSADWYENAISKKYVSRPGQLFEIKKEFVFEKDYKSKVMTIYTVLPE